VIKNLFTTPIAYLRVEPETGQLEEVAEYLRGLRLRESNEEIKRSNRGGWHSDGNLFGEEHREFPWLRDLVVKSIIAYAGKGLGFDGEFEFDLTAWAVVNGAGHYNVPHNHNPFLISGALYIQVPGGMEDGEIVFLDPRTNLNASVPRSLLQRGQLPPWNRTSIAHTPRCGDLLLFPSWLMHYVNAFTAPDPTAERIVISFNAGV